MPEELISVIVVNWNNKDMLRDCLASLENQTYKNREIIVIDNGSTDESVDLVKNNFPEVKIFALSKNMGFSAGNNLGIRNARGNYIALINNDAEAHPKWLEALYDGLIKNPNIGFCASKMLFFYKRDTIDATGNIFYDTGIAEKRGWMKKDSDEFNKPVEVFGACAGAAIYKKKMLEKIGFFDEDFSPAYYEDVDLDFRAQLQGYRCLYIPEAIVYHRVTSSIGLYSQKHIYLCNRNLSYVLIKNIPAPLLLKYFPKILIYLLISILYHYLVGRGNAYFFGRIAALGKLSIMLKKRKTIQRSKLVSDEYIDSIIIKWHFSTSPKKFLKWHLVFSKFFKK